MPRFAAAPRHLLSSVMSIEVPTKLRHDPVFTYGSAHEKNNCNSRRVDDPVLVLALATFGKPLVKQRRVSCEIVRMDVERARPSSVSGLVGSNPKIRLVSSDRN